MCGRYATTRSETDLGLLFDAVDVTGGLGPSWNVAPTDPVPLIRMSQSHPSPEPPSQESPSPVPVPSRSLSREPPSPGPGGRVLDVGRWGLVPPWADDLRAGARMINARAETVATSRAFAPSFARRRCLIPADGWYEWIRDRRSRQAYYMTPRDGSGLAFAGIWTRWRSEVLTCSVLTTAALGGLARVHDRMPLILPRDRWAGWLAGGGDPADLLRPLPPAELDAIEIRAVRPDVGNVRNNGPELIEPPAVPDPAPVALF